MPHHRPLALLIAAVFAVPAAQASVDLVAIGSLDGHGRDLSTQTAGALENGAPGNLLGGMGSGLEYAGNNLFLALPDRGPNATPYNSTLSDTASYIPRFHTLRMDLTPSAPGSALPLLLNPVLQSTPPLYARPPLVYGNRTPPSVAPGAPALNSAQPGRYYLSGRSDNFNPALPSTAQQDARFDPEGIRVGADGYSVFISDEYGPYIYRFNLRTGERTDAFKMPAGFAITSLDANGDAEIAKNASSGRVSNKGMEGLAILTDRRTLFDALQSPREQDGGTAAPYLRIARVTGPTGGVFQVAYPLTNIGTVAKPKYPTVSEILAINDHEFLVDERDGKGLGDNSTASYKRIYRINISGAHNVASLSGSANLAPYAVEKTPFLDLVSALGAHGIAANDFPAKIEGMAFGPDVNVGGKLRHTLWIANDNDFIPTVTDSLHPNGIANPNRWFVFAFDDADLPGYAAAKR